mgnify:FL=1
MLERQIEAYLRDRVKAAGGIAYKFVSPTNRGVCDRIVVMPGGVVWFVELKTATGRLTPLQVQFGKTMEALGQRYAVIRSKEEVNEWLQRCN